jgi:hypothetical protein
MSSSYDGFFGGFGFVVGGFTTLDENSPIWGGFGFPRILMTSLQSLSCPLEFDARNPSLHLHAPNPPDEIPFLTMVDFTYNPKTPLARLC